MDYPKMLYRAKPDCPPLTDADVLYSAWKDGKIEYMIVQSVDESHEGYCELQSLVASIEEVMPLEPKRRGRPPKAD